LLAIIQAQTIRFLRWSEKYTKTDMVYLAHGSFWLSSSSVITSAVSFGLALAFANLISKDAYGTYKYAQTLFGVLCITCLRGMDSVVTQGAARGKDATVITGLWAKIRWSTLGSLAALVGAAYYIYSENYPVAYTLLIAAVFVPMMEPFGIFNAVLVGKKDFKVSSLLGSAGQIAAAAALFLSLLLLRNPTAIFATYCGIWTLTRFLSLRYTLKKYPPNGQSETDGFSYGLHSSIAAAAAVLISSIDSILVYHYLGAAELALYTFAMAPVSQVRGLLNTPTQLAIPKLAQRSSAEIRHILIERTFYLLLLGVAINAA
jgi:O-antigen/teichoic acid export membrane protein